MIDPQRDENRFYVYTYTSSLDSKVFYVGKGSGERYLQHVIEARRKDIIYFSGPKIPRKVVATVRSIWQQGGKVIIRKPHKNLTEHKAIQLEKSLMTCYKSDQLVNQRWPK